MTPLWPRRPWLMLVFFTCSVAIGSTAGAAEQARIKVAALHIRGAHAVSESRLKSILATHSSGSWPWSKARYFDRDAFEHDLERLRAFYVDRGYPDAKVADIETKLSDDQSRISLTISIEEGDPNRVESIAFDRFDAIAERLPRLRQLLPIQPGAVLATSDLTAARDMAVREFQNNGYPNAAVAIRQENVAEKSVALTLTADAGVAAVFGDVTIDGNTSVGSDVIDRELAVRPNQPFSLGALQRSQRRLYDLDLFKVASVEPLLTAAEGGEVPVRVAVVEDKHRRLEWRMGYGTEERLRAGLTWKHLNFFGGARTATFESKWSSLDRGVRLSLRQPYVLGPDTSLTISGQRWFSDEPSYKLDTLGGRVTITREWARLDPVGRRHATTAVSLSIGHDAEAFSISNDALADLSFRDELIALGLDPRTGTGEGRLTTIGLDVRRGTADNPLDSHRGYLVEGHLEKGGGWLPGNYNYLEATAEARHFQPVGRSLVIANRVRVGAIGSAGPLALNVPFFKRYFIGGTTSLRGWGRFEVAPLSGSGLPLGGHRMLEMSSELRLTGFKSLALVAFVDAGNVWTEPHNEAWTLKADAGPGLRYATPIGPLRVDLAFQLTPIDGLLVDGKPEDRHWRLQFSIGQAF
jgi:outer membrane protein assembly complex protein YaeT